MFTFSLLPQTKLTNEQSDCSHDFLMDFGLPKIFLCESKLNQGKTNLSTDFDQSKQTTLKMPLVNWMQDHFTLDLKPYICDQLQGFLFCFFWLKFDKYIHAQ